jgi:NADP-reducing hydrogenase subunit HndD
MVSKNDTGKIINVTIDGRPVKVPEGTTILHAAQSVGVFLPTLCYLKEVNDIGACRVCVVEVEGYGRLVTSCNTAVKEGMVIHTNSPQARETRRVNVELILSQHDTQCASCVRSGNCVLQTVANDLGIIYNNYKKDVPKGNWNKSFPLIRHESKCIKCMRCIQYCNNVQNIGVWDSINSGGRTTVGVSGGRSISESDCSLCGQCITHCPVGALRVRDDTDRVFEALADPDRITVVQIAPAVRVAWGETLGLNREFANVKRLVAAFRKMGFDYVFDTTFSADLTIMEEGSEFVRILTGKDKRRRPLFTSCCPGWVRFVKSHYPDMVDQLSTAKSPQQMFGAVAKTYLAELLQVDPSKIFCVSVMPCVAKKSECDLPTMRDDNGMPDVDCVLTTREIDRMIKAEHILPTQLEEEEFDDFAGIGSGAGVIFGAAGGVMEAALRSVYYLITGENPTVEAFSDVRGRNGWREATYFIKGDPIRVAVVSGLGNARKLIEALRTGEVQYDFVEVMSCPGGCAGGGGQPITPGQEKALERGESLYGIDRASSLRFSHENPEVRQMYEYYSDKPMMERVQHKLHTDHSRWHMPLSPNHK